MRMPHKPSAVCEIRTGAAPDASKGKKSVTAWSYGEAWRLNDAGKWEPHPAFHGEQRHSFTIEILSDVLDFNLQSHLACYDGKTAFCFRPFRGDDSVGICTRRTADGGRGLTECDPERCAIRQNAAEPDSKTSEVTGAYQKAYPHGKLTTRNRDNLPVGAKCRPYMFFIFKLICPDGSYAHPEGEFCIFDSHSDANAERIEKKLRWLMVETGGHIAGLRLNLVFSPVETRYGTTAPAWELRVPEGTDFESLRLQAAQRVQKRMYDYGALPAETISTALVKAREDVNLERWVASDYPDAMRTDLHKQLQYEQVRVNKINPDEVYLVHREPLVEALIKRLGLHYAYVTRLPLDFGQDYNKCVLYLAGIAAKNNIDISDLVPDAKGPMAEDRGVANTTARPATETPPRSEEPEFTVVEDDEAEDLVKRSKGK